MRTYLIIIVSILAVAGAVAIAPWVKRWIPRPYSCDHVGAVDAYSGKPRAMHTDQHAWLAKQNLPDNELTVEMRLLLLDAWRAGFLRAEQVIFDLPDPGADYY